MSGKREVMAVRNIEVHRAHCCRLHGCKYGAEDCPVAMGEFVQFSLCEVCCQDGILTMSELRAVTLGSLKTCPHCGHVLRDQEKAEHQESEGEV